MVTPEHEAFARAVVALARAHQMNGLRLSFRKSFTSMDARGPFEEVSVDWTEGRHGDRSRIRFETRGSHEIAEVEPTQPSGDRT